MIKKIVTSLSFAVFMAIIIGILTGGVPRFSEEISTVALIVAMTLSLTRIDLRKMHIKKNQLWPGLLINYGFLSLVTIILGLFFPDDLWNGFIIIAAVPPAVAIIPITTILRGDVEYALVSLSVLYLFSLLLTPLILFSFLGETINTIALLRTLVLIIVLPLFLAQGVRRINIPSTAKTLTINFCFFILLFILVGENRAFLFQGAVLIFWLAVAMFLRTFGTGGLIKIITKRLGVPKEKQIPLILMAAIKNEGLALILAISLFTGMAAVPAIIALIFEMLWISCFEAKLC